MVNPTSFPNSGDSDFLLPEKKQVQQGKAYPTLSYENPMAKKNIPSIKPQEVQEIEESAISLDAELDPKTLAAFSSIDHFLDKLEYVKILSMLRDDSLFIENIIKYEEFFTKSKKNFSVPNASRAYPTINQEHYSILLKAYTAIGFSLKQKYEWNLYQLLTFFSCARYCMQRTLDTNFEDFEKENIASVILHGFPRTKGMTTYFNNIYEYLGTYMKNFFSEKGFNIIYNAKDYNRANISLSISLMDCLIHTSPEKINQILDHVSFLFKQTELVSDKAEIVSLTGKMFWWICHAKPWLYGDPSIAEMLIRSIWIEKEIPNDPWISTIIPWGETVLEPDVEKFGENFDNLFDRSTINKIKISTSNIF